MRAKRLDDLDDTVRVIKGAPSGKAGIPPMLPSLMPPSRGPLPGSEISIEGKRMLEAARGVNLQRSRIVEHLVAGATPELPPGTLVYDDPIPSPELEEKRRLHYAKQKEVEELARKAAPDDAWRKIVMCGWCRTREALAGRPMIPHPKSKVLGFWCKTCVKE
jgi:hypothetical protein